MNRVISSFLTFILLCSICMPQSILAESSPAEAVSFSSLNDPNLRQYLENKLYSELVDNLDADDIYIEDVSTIYLSQEYIDRLEFNSKKNVYFGYTKDEINALFQDNKYYFTLGENGQTIVQPYTEYDDTYEQCIKNVAIGTGVILICVTASILTAGTSTAVSMIFAVAAKSGAISALSGAAIGGISAGIITGIQTKDFKSTVDAMALSASDGYKWGAIIGAATGGIKEGIALKKAGLHGLTMNQAAIIQKESKWPLAAIKNLHSVEEYGIYKNAELIPTQLSDGTWAFLRKIDWSLVDDLGRNNVQRVLGGLAPIDATKMPYELHHIGMRADSPLAILTHAEHHAKQNYKILHYLDEGKNVLDTVWAQQKKEFWESVLKMAQGGI